MKIRVAKWCTTSVALAVLMLLMAPAVRAQVSPTEKAKYRTDLNSAPETVPALCSPKTQSGNCRMLSSDLNPSVKYFRVTNPDTLAPFYSPRQFGASNSIDNDWSKDDSSFLVTNPNGSVVPIQLDSSVSPLATKPIACNNSDPHCTCNQASPSCSMTVSGVLNIGGTAVFSEATANVLISAVNGSNGWAFDYVDLRPTIASASAGTATTALTPPISGCSGIQLPAGNTVGLIGVSQNDGRIATSTGGTSQDNWGIVYVWDSTKKACRYLDTTTMTIGGDAAWGSPTGKAQMVNENGDVLAANDIRYKICSTNGSSAPPCMHGVILTPDGVLAAFSTSVDNYQYFWDIDTQNIYLCGVNQESGTCSGHGILAYGLQLFLLNSSESLIQTHGIPGSAALPSAQLYPIADEPSGFGDYVWDTHTNWNNNTGANAQPFLTLPWGVGLYPPTTAWGDELIMGYATGATTMYRIAHTYNRALTTDVGTNYYDEGLPQISHGGKFAIFGSSWGGTDTDAGNSACTSTPCYRTDVFLVPLPSIP
jgi:hypothetical protein